MCGSLFYSFLLCYRFAGIPKRQIIPQVIANTEVNTNINGELNEKSSIIASNQDLNSPLATNDTLAASLAASLAVTVTQPFMKIQNELENKMNNLLKQLESHQLKDDSKGVVLNENYEQTKRVIEDDVKCLTEMKLKYIEKLQENQVNLIKSRLFKLNSYHFKLKFQLMAQLISVIGKENLTQKTQNQAQEKMNDLLNDYKNELINFKVKVNNMESTKTTTAVAANDERFKTQVISTTQPSGYISDDEMQRQQKIIRSRTRSKSRASKSPNRPLLNKSPSKKSTKKASAKKSVSPVKQIEPDYDCLQCVINQHENTKPLEKRNEFLEELLENSSPDRKMRQSPTKQIFDQSIGYENI